MLSRLTGTSLFRMTRAGKEGIKLSNMALTAAKSSCNWPIVCIKSKGALLMMLVSFGLLTYWSAIPGGDVYSDATFLQKLTSKISLYLIRVFQVFYPLIGWIADTWIGRYRAILYGLYIMFVSVILLSIRTFISYLHPELDILANIFLFASNIVNTLGMATVIATMIPFITDQMIGASSEQFSAVIHWYYWSYYSSYFIAYNQSYLHNTDISVIVLIAISFFGLGIALCSIILGKHWLDKTHKVTNPIKHIVKVLNYAKKNKYPENRSALTYWEHDIPSRVDLGKQKYGGPFTEDEVENVKTTLRLIPIIFVITCVATATHVTDTQQQHMIVSMNDLACFIRDEQCITILTGSISIPIYHLIIRPILHKLHVLNKCSMSSLKLIGCGVILIIAGTVGMTCIEGIGHLQTPNATCMFNTRSMPISINYYWVTIPLIVKAIGNNVFSLFSLQFIIAQSPQEMKGFLIGLFYGLDGIFKLIGFNLYRLFLFNRTSGCGFYYYLCHTVILLIILIVYLFLSKNYKLRVRNDPVNVHLIAETHIMAYIEQESDHEEEYRILYTPNVNYYNSVNS